MTDTAQPVAATLAAVKATLTVAAVAAKAPGGVHNDLPNSPTYPCLRLWARGKPIGPIAGHSVWSVDVEVWIYSLFNGDAEALAAAEVVIGLLNNQPLTVAGWRAVLVALEDLFSANDEDLNGQPLKAWVLPFTIQLDQVP